MRIPEPVGQVFFGVLSSSGVGARDYSAAFSAALDYEIAVFWISGGCPP